MALPLKLLSDKSGSIAEWEGQTRDVSFRGLFFMMDSEFEMGRSLEFILTLPREITLAGDVQIHCFAHVVRVESHSGRSGIAASIDRYEFLPTPA